MLKKNIFQDSLMNRKFKRTTSIWIFCNIMNVFTIIFEKCNASFVNKSINFFKKNWMVVYARKIKL